MPGILSLCEKQTFFLRDTETLCWADTGPGAMLASTSLGAWTPGTTSHRTQWLTLQTQSGSAGLLLHLDGAGLSLQSSGVGFPFLETTRMLAQFQNCRGADSEFFT
jgi:hypothetical protein